MAVLKEAPESQFAYVVVVSRRARQLMMGGRPLLDNPKSRKPARIAEEELRHGLLEFEMSELMEESEDRGGKQRK